MRGPLTAGANFGVAGASTLRELDLSHVSVLEAQSRAVYFANLRSLSLTVDRSGLPRHIMAPGLKKLRLRSDKSLSGLSFAQLSFLSFDFNAWPDEAIGGAARDEHRCIRGALYWQNALVFLRSNHFPALKTLDICCYVGSYAFAMDLAMCLKTTDTPHLATIRLDVELPRARSDREIPVDSYDAYAVR